MAAKKKCVCDEMSRSTEFFTAKTFDCPVHGRITIDKRLVPAPVPYTQPASPNIPYWPPCTPYVGDPPGGPYGSTWGGTHQVR